jgi:hypothetical protein
MKKFFKIQSMSKGKKRIFLGMSFTLVFAICLGIMIGFYIATGGSIIDKLSPGPSAYVPNATLQSLSTTEDILNTQPIQSYGSGYNCVDFAWAAMRALQWQGQPSAIVRLGFTDGTGHALLIVPTSDNGWRFIEPQANIVVYPSIGNIYDGKVIANITILTATWAPFKAFEQDPNFGIQGWDDKESK